MPDLYHLMFQDSVRMGLWEQGIRAVVRPGDVMADVGSAMGTFSLFAVQNGARRVYGIEAERIVDVAREAARRAGLDDRVEFIEAYSTEVDLPEKADVVLFEDFTSLLLHANVGTIIRDARQRFLKPGGTLIPQSADLLLAPFEDAELYTEIDPYGDDASDRYGFDFTAMREMAVNSVTYHAFAPDELLAEPAHARHYDFETEETFDCRLEGRFLARREGILHGIAVWFEAQIAPEVRMSNAPGQPTTIWHQGVLPVEAPTPVAKGDQIDVRVETVRSEAYGFHWNWTVRVADPQNVAPVLFRQSTFRAEPLPGALAEALQREGKREERGKQGPEGRP